MKKVCQMQAGNINFLMDHASESCPPLQFLREFTQNSIEALQGEVGTIKWDYIEIMGVKKLCVTDNGCGMDKEELFKYMNGIYESGKKQTIDANFGVGAKISAVRQNPEGLIIQSWKNGVGHAIQLGRINGQYGAIVEDGYEEVYEVDDSQKPVMIEQHGTRVIFLGKDLDDPTFEPPDRPSRWIANYLTQKYFKLPDNINISVRDGGTYKSRQVHGTYKNNHESASQIHGVKSFRDFRVHWFIRTSTARNAIDVNCRVAALYKDELYEAKVGRAISATLNQFGIYFAPTKISLYVEPTSGYHANQTRTALIYKGEGIPWEEWGKLFADDLPEEIKVLEREIANKTRKDDHSADLNAILKDCWDLFKNASQPTSASQQRESGGRSGDGDEDGALGGGGSDGGNAPKPPKPKPNVDYAKLFGKGDQKTPKSIEVPNVHYTTEAESSIDELKNRAGVYIEENNSLVINTDFIGYQVVVKSLVEKFGDNNRVPVEESVFHAAYVLLAQTVLVSKSYTSEHGWNKNQREAGWSPEALSAVVGVRMTLKTEAEKMVKKKIKALEAQKNLEDDHDQ